MTLSTQPYKGARDFYPEDKAFQNYMFGVWRKVVERYGYEEYDAPILEPLEIYLAKTGEEIVNGQTYVFEDRGERRVVIRPEMTPTVSRMVAGRRQELAYPLRWFSIPNLWRYERPQRGRLREHWQLNVDLFGSDDLKGELEMIQICDDILKAFGATEDMYVVRVNDRKLSDLIMKSYLELNIDQAHSMVKLIDRMHKIERAQFELEAEEIFTEKQRESGSLEKLNHILNVKTIDKLPQLIRETSHAKDLEKLLHMVKAAGVTNAEFDITLMRGFDYYTGIVFEIFDKHPDNNRSMMGGGRYDGLVGLFGVDPVPTVGFGWGDVTMQNFIEGHKLLPNVRSKTDVYVVLLGDIYDKALGAINELRATGVNVAVDFSGRKPEKQIKTALKKGINYVVFIGERELADELYEVKNLANGAQERQTIARIATTVLGDKDGDRA